MGGSDGPRRKNHFARCPDILLHAFSIGSNAHDLAVFQHQAVYRRSGDNLKVGPFLGTAKIGDGGAASLAAICGLLKVPYTFLVTGIVIGVAVISRIDCSFDPRLDNFPVQSDGRHSQGSVPAPVAVKRRLTMPGLRANEIRKNILPGPAAIAELPPMVIVHLLSAHI